MSNNNHLMHNYAPLAVTFSHGSGAKIFDTDGKEYLDALSGIAVCGLGHAHPAVTKAITEQAGKLLHTSNLYYIENQQQLADRLCGLSGLTNAFFSNSGAEANEAAIKIARLFGHNKNIDKPAIIVMENSFHGRTMATLSATGSRKVQAGFEPLVQGFVRAPFNDIESIKNIAKNNSNVVAIMVEPIQGESGIRVPDENYLRELRDICDQHDWLLILDEIQTGMGRTGEWFAFQHEAIKPDVMTLAKALGNGVPIGACLAGNKAAEVFQPGNHGSTFGGNPLACAAALAVIDVMESDSLVEQAKALGESIVDGLNNNLSSVPSVKEVRGKGLMLGIEMEQDCTELISLALDQGLLLSVQAGNTIRLLPPLIIDQQQAIAIIDSVSQLIIDWTNKEAA